MKTGRKLAGAAALFAAGAAACGGGPDLTGTSRVLPPHYELVQYGGEPLPVVLNVAVSIPATPDGSSVRCENRLVAMTLAFTGRNQYSAVRERLQVCDDGRPNVGSMDVEPGTYTAYGDNVLMTGSPQDGVVHRSYAHTAGDSLNVYRQETASESGGGTVSDPTKLVFLVSP